MTDVTTLRRGEALTREDLEATPDDGHRYELVDGSLIVTPAPSNAHQTVVLELAVALRAACPDHLKVLFAPFDVALTEDTVVQPDLLVAQRSDFTARDLPTAPMLAVEVLSPNTRHVDLALKRARYQTAGSPSYWVVDPDEPALTVFELEHGAYVERAHVTGDEEYVATIPFPLTLIPARLLD